MADDDITFTTTTDSFTTSNDYEVYWPDTSNSIRYFPNQPAWTDTEVSIPNHQYNTLLDYGLLAQLEKRIKELEDIVEKLGYAKDAKEASLKSGFTEE